MAIPETVAALLAPLRTRLYSRPSHVVSPWSPQHPGSEVIQPHRQEGGQRCGSLVRVAPGPREKREWSPVLSGSQHLGCLLCQLFTDNLVHVAPVSFLGYIQEQGRCNKSVG